MIVECPCGLVVKCKWISFYQLQYSIVTSLVFKTTILYIRVDGTITVYYYKPILLCTKSIFVLFMSG